MLAEALKGTVRRWYEEVCNQGRLDVTAEVFADNYEDLDAPSPSGLWPRGAEGARQSILVYREAFPDFHCEIDEMIAEERSVAVRYRWTGTHNGAFLNIPPTGKKIEVSALAFWHFGSGGEITESWGQFDVVEIMQQLGEVPRLSEAGPETPSSRGPAV